MTDLQLATGILNNDERAWRFICRNMKAGIFAKVREKNIFINPQDLEDIFQESCLILMQRVKEEKFESNQKNGIFNFLVTTGNNLARNVMRKKSKVTLEETIPEPDKKLNQDPEISAEEKQRTQNEYLDRIYSSIPADCRKILKLSIWDRKPMDDIASIMGMKNADSAITKKSKCMNKFKEIGKMLIENDEFAEEVVRNAVERAALRALLEEEKENSDEGFMMAAFNPDDDEK